MNDCSVIQHCEVCNAPPVFYQRVRNKDALSDSTQHPVFSTVPVRGAVNELLDVVIHSCGGTLTRIGRKLFSQPAGANGFAEYDMHSWTEHVTCPEAARLLKELREKTVVHIDTLDAENRKG